MDKNKSLRYIILIAAGVIIAVAGYMIWRHGLKGFFSLLTKFLWVFIIIALVTGIVMLVVWLFQWREIDMIALTRKRIIKAAKMNKTEYIQTLKFRALADEWAQRTVGRIVGMALIKSEPLKSEVINSDTGEIKLKVVNAKRLPELLFIIIKPTNFFGGLMADLLGDYDIIAGPKEDFSNLAADTVYLHGMTFAPEIFGLLFLSHHWEERHMIDETIKEAVHRFTLQENLKQLNTIVEDAIAASPRHKKEMERQNVQMLPISGAAQPPPPR